MAYFNNPEQAVKAIKVMMLASRWVTLGRYYVAETRDQYSEAIASGAFFKRDPLSGATHPGGFDQWRQPFAPSFDYLSHQSLADGRVRVEVYRLIDQGRDSPPQEGRDHFLLLSTPHGYQLLAK